MTFWYLMHFHSFNLLYSSKNPIITVQLTSVTMKAELTKLEIKFFIVFICPKLQRLYFALLFSAYFFQKNIIINCIELASVAHHRPTTPYSLQTHHFHYVNLSFNTPIKESLHMPHPMEGLANHSSAVMKSTLPYTLVYEFPYKYDINGSRQAAESVTE